MQTQKRNQIYLQSFTDIYICNSVTYQVLHYTVVPQDQRWSPGESMCGENITSPGKVTAVA